MRIGVMQPSSQRGRNTVLYRCVQRALERNGRPDTAVNIGVFPDEEEAYSYVETALGISLLLSSGAVDMVVTGCSSGQGMMLACNSLPKVMCGFVQTPQDAFLFGRINGGNAVSFPLGLNYGWLGEIGLQCAMDKLFEGEFGCGYPPEEAERKRRDARYVDRIAGIVKRPLPEALGAFEPDFVDHVLKWPSLRREILSYGTDDWIRRLAEEGTASPR